MIEILKKTEHGQVWMAVALPLAEARSENGAALLEVLAVAISGEDVNRVIALFRESIPRVYFAADGTVTWFGDHARFIVGNWR